jgi:hypothetical protein
MTVFYIGRETHLRRGDTSSQQLQQVSSLENDVRVPGLPRGLHGHSPLYQIQLARETVRLEGRSDLRPDRTEVWFSVFREEEGERGFLEERLVLIGSGLGHGVDLPATCQLTNSSNQDPN